VVYEKIVHYLIIYANLTINYKTVLKDATCCDCSFFAWVCFSYTCCMYRII